MLCPDAADLGTLLVALEDLALPGLTSSQRPCWSVTVKGTPTDSELTHQAHLLLTLHTTGHCAPALITQVRENRDSSYSWKLTEMPQGHPLLQVPSQLLSLFHRTSIGVLSTAASPFLPPQVPLCGAWLVLSFGKLGEQTTFPLTAGF